MKNKFNIILKILLLSFALSFFLTPNTVLAQEAPLTNCSVVSFTAPFTADHICAVRQQIVAGPENCLNLTGLEANKTCCCTKGLPTPPKEYSCNWRIKYTYSNPNNPTFQNTVSGGCLDTETKGPDCNPNNKPVIEYSPYYSKELSCCCPAISKPKYAADVILPNLSIKIDTIKLTKEIFCDGANGTGNCYYPWIAEYINGLYKYGFGIAGILAAIMLMAGGVIWLISAGDASKITQAKDLMTGSVVGLIILSTSYIILSTINPQLVSLKPISIKMVERLAESEVRTKIDEGENPYQAGCDASRKGDHSVCEQYGNNPPENMKIIPGTNDLTTEVVLAKYQSAMACVRQLNNNKDLFKVTSAWRSPERQLSLFKQLGHPQAAYPCCSNHGKGTALDLARIDSAVMTWAHNDDTGLTTCMNAQGLYANLKGQGTSPNEPWHWSLSGR